MDVYCFGSSSRGNAFLFRTRRCALLVDAGFSPRYLRRALLACGIGDHELTAILITHEHSDHVRGLQRLLDWQSCPVLATPGTFRALRLDGHRFVTLRPEQWLEIGDLALQAVPVQHDASEPIGLRIATEAVLVAFFTDAGRVTDEMRTALSEANFVVLEANHDRRLLAASSYPDWLKRRIASPLGHLSNDDAAAAMRDCGTHLRTLWLAHLSEENNRPELAVGTVRRALPTGGVVSLTALPPHGCFHWAPHQSAIGETE